jgi:hypothetical protein
MRNLKFNFILLGVLCTSSSIFAQDKNRITLQTGLFHCFFDGSPLMNTNYQSKGAKPFNGLLINSLGIQYRRAINEKSAFSVDYDYFEEGYRKYYGMYPTYEPMIGTRSWLTVKFNYIRILPLNDRFDFVYGGGINFRSGREVIIITNGIIGSIHGEPAYESLVIPVGRNDIGLNAFAGLDYSPLKWLTFSSRIDFLSSIIMYKTDGRQKMKDVYDSPQFPSRYDLSFNLGVGFNF